MSADRSYRPGQQVYTTYGDMDNAKRLFSFGFVTLTLPRASDESATTVQSPAFTTRNSDVEVGLALPTEAY